MKFERHPSARPSKASESFLGAEGVRQPSTEAWAGRRDFTHKTSAAAEASGAAVVARAVRAQPRPVPADGGDPGVLALPLRGRSLGQPIATDGDGSSAKLEAQAPRRATHPLRACANLLPGSLAFGLAFGLGFGPAFALPPALAAGPSVAQEATYSVRLLTPEVALAAAQAALAQCRNAGHQVAVAVVDRSGVLQVLLRDRYAGAHTVEAATRKAWTAASFRMPTATLAAETQAGKAMSGIRALPQALAIGGGQVIEAGGSAFGGIGVSGAPGGEADDACATAGLKAIADAIEF